MIEGSPEHPGIGRRRDRMLVDALRQAAMRHGGTLTETGCFEAVCSVHQNGVTPSSAVAIVRKKLHGDPAFHAALAAVCAIAPQLQS